MTDTPATGPVSEVTPPETPPAIPGGPTLSLGQAVKVTGVSRSTLQRRLTAGQITGAERTTSGGWSIPLAGLISAGMAPRVTPADPNPEPSTTSGPAISTEVAAVAAERDRLAGELAATRAELDKARTIAEVQARHLDDLREALAALSRALPPGPATGTDGAPSAVTPARRRWWKR